MLTGILLEESLADRSAAEGLHVTAAERWSVAHPAPFQPAVWTALRFEEDEARAFEWMERFSRALRPAWYVNASTGSKVFIACPGRVFSYPRGDAAARAEVTRFGLEAGVPSWQLDWPE